MIRLFIALHLNQEVKDYLGSIITDFKTKGGKIKYVEPHNLHLTMKFLGNTDPSQVNAIKENLKEATNSFSPIESKLNSLGGFPNLKKPKVIWVGLDAKEKLAELAGSIETKLTELEIPKNDKPFKPHLTLGRVKQNDGMDELVNYLDSYKFEPMDIIFDKLSLIQSTLTQQGPIYKPLLDIKLEQRFGI